MRAFLRWRVGVMEGDPRACHAFAVTTDVAGVGSAAMMVCGEQDTQTPPQYAPCLPGHIPGSRLVPLPDAGHDGVLERPAALTRARAEFLAGLPPER